MVPPLDNNVDADLRTTKNTDVHDGLLLGGELLHTFGYHKRDGEGAQEELTTEAGMMINTDEKCAFGFLHLPQLQRGDRMVEIIRMSTPITHRAVTIIPNIDRGTDGSIKDQLGKKRDVHGRNGNGHRLVIKHFAVVVGL